MPGTLSSAFAVAAILIGALPSTDARATPIVAPSSLGAAATMRTPVAMVCGRNGCAPISVKRVWHQPRGFAKRAAPLNMPASNPPPNAQQNASANK